MLEQRAVIRQAGPPVLFSNCNVYSNRLQRGGPSKVGRTEGAEEEEGESGRKSVGAFDSARKQTAALARKVCQKASAISLLVTAARLRSRKLRKQRRLSAPSQEKIIHIPKSKEH
ncbi:hypothetical protein MHYP_G00335760 [Metynnis hypsauchen]